MDKALDFYLDLWGWFFWPLKKVAAYARRAADQVNIWLIGDFVRLLLLTVVFMLGSFYVVLFMFAPPVSLYLLACGFLAVIARYYARRLGGAEGPAPIRAGFLAESASMSAWASLGFVALSGAQFWLNWREGADPVQFAAFETTLVDATAALRRAASPQNLLIVLTALLGAAFVFRSLKPIAALGAARRTVSALLAVGAVVTGFSFVTAHATGDRHARIAGEIVASARADLEGAARDRRETAAMRWAGAQLAARPLQQRARMLAEIAAFSTRAEALCAREREEFEAAFIRTVAQASEAPPEGYDARTAALDYCSSGRLVAEALRPAVRATDAAAEAAADAADDIEWKKRILSGERAEIVHVLTEPDAPTPSDLSIRELRAAQARVARAAAEAAQARAIVRATLVEGISTLLGTGARGLAEPVLEALQRAIMNVSARRIEKVLMTWWSPDAPAARITGDGVELHPSHADDVHLAALSEAHGVQGGRGNAQLADDILAKVWPSLRPPGGAVAAAEAAAAAAIAASAVSLRGARGVKGPRRIPRIRI